MLTWNAPNERYNEHGLDRGVLYLPGRDPVPWNGLVSVDEGQSGTTTMFYRDGVVFLADADASDFVATLNARFFPNEFHECLGMPEAADGLYIDNQKPKRFGLSYRSLIGSGGVDDLFGYQIHLIYNVMASIAPRQRNTLGDEVDTVEFTFNLVCTPVKLPGYRPSAHFVIDTRHMSPGTIQELEDLIYGDGTTPGQLPSPTALYDIMNFGDAMTFTVHPDGYYTVEGSSSNLWTSGPNQFTMKNVNGTANPDGTYDISDGGDTVIVVE